MSIKHFDKRGKDMKNYNEYNVKKLYKTHAGARI